MGGHWHAGDDCAVCDQAKRIAELEQKLDRLTRGIHLTLASVKPGLDWIDGPSERAVPDGGS